MWLIWMTTILLLSSEATANRIWESIYQDLDATYSCFKILNGTHEFGCRADFTGNVGLLRVVNSSADLTRLTTSGERQSVVAVVPRQWFTVDTLQRLERMTADPDQGDVKGVILMLPDEDWGPDEAFQYSEDDSCPNRWSSFYRSDPASAEFRYCPKTPWNPAGTGMFKRSWSFPIILLKNQTQIDDLVKCHHQYNSAGAEGPWPRCAAQMKTFMSAAGNSEICWRRSQRQNLLATQTGAFCSPMGSTNLFSTWLPPAAAPAPAADTVLVAARTDGATMFDRLAPGADSAVVGMVALMAAARAMADLTPPQNTTTNVMFMLFSGESFDYIGSDRMVYDMSLGKFPPQAVVPDDEKAGSKRRPAPMRLSNVSYYLELNQLARGTPLFLHSDPVTRRKSPQVDSKVRELMNSLRTYADPGRYDVPLADPAPGTPLPPSSLHALLRGNDTVPGLVVTDHNQSYTNSFFHSVYDVRSTVTTGGDLTELADRLSRLAQVVASAAYGLATGQTAPDVTVDKKWVADLLECYLVRANCSLFRDAMDSEMSDKTLTRLWQKNRPLPTYVSVAGQATMHSYLMRLTHNVLSRWTGETLANVTNADKCRNDTDRIYSHRWLIRQLENGTLSGYCTRSLVEVSSAVSPAFEIDDYDWSSGDHPTWAESQWIGFELRIFLMPSLGHELLHLLLGLTVTLLAVGLVLLAERRGHLLFESPRLRPLRSAGAGGQYGSLTEPVAT
ncbi:nicastrin-like isoform X1 [Amphibalanus amphitrite]|uniref:nicastrin-like isoform X1 n=1 Tax=Amphibalanus amphitrite TaxID=1232801 RepID=UPI001C8FE61B|nr:nicastrin-like isoform X1 [Amphibalanus amphitrite]